MFRNDKCQSEPFAGSQCFIGSRCRFCRLHARILDFHTLETNRLAVRHPDFLYLVQILSDNLNLLTHLGICFRNHFRNRRQRYGQLTLRIHDVRHDGSRIRNCNPAATCLLRDNKTDRLACMLNEILLEYGHLVRKYHCMHQVQILTGNGQLIARTYGSRTERLDGYRFQISKFCLGRDVPVRSLQDHLPRLRVLRYSDTDFRITDHCNLSHFTAAGENHRCHTVHSASQKAQLTATEHGTRSEHVQVDATHILIGADFIVVTGSHAQTSGQKQSNQKNY